MCIMVCPSEYSLLFRFNDPPTVSIPIDTSVNGFGCIFNGALNTDIGIIAKAPDHFIIQSSCFFQNDTYVSAPTVSSEMHLGGEFTIDFWVKFNDVTSTVELFGPETPEQLEQQLAELDSHLIKG